MAHQTHTLPWNNLAKHFKYLPLIPHKLGPHRPDIVSLQKETQTFDINLFALALQKSIKDFSTQLRSRFPQSETHYVPIATKWKNSDGERAQINNRKVYSEEIKEKYADEECISNPYGHPEDYQDISTWILRTYRNPAGELIYSTAYNHNIELPPVIKVLIKEAAHLLDGRTKTKQKQNDPVEEVKEESTADEAMETLLLLANHPLVPLLSLKTAGYYYSCGIGSIARSCLDAYLMLNLLIAMQDVGSPLGEELGWDSARPQPVDFKPEKRYTQCLSYRRIVERCTSHYDSVATRKLHGEIFHLEVVHSGRSIIETKELDCLADMAACRGYLKMLWRIMVVYDVVIREAGGDPDWVQEVLESLRCMFHIPSEWNEDYTKLRLLCGTEKKSQRR